MDQKRFLVFIVVSMGILIGWNVFVMPKFLPPPKPKGAQNQVEKGEAVEKQPEVADKGGAAGPGEAEGEAGEPVKEFAPDGAKPAAAEKATEEPAAEAEKPDENVARDRADSAEKLPRFPEKTVLLGSDEFATGYRQLVTLTSKGAAVEHIQLNDPRYRQLKKNAGRVHPPLVVVGEDDVVPRTLESDVPQLHAGLDKLNWELVELAPQEEPHSVAVFRLKLDDLEVVKRYELPMIAPKSEAPAYSMKVDLTFRNLGKQARTVNYSNSPRRRPVKRTRVVMHRLPAHARRPCRSHPVVSLLEPHDAAHVAPAVRSQLEQVDTRGQARAAGTGSRPRHLVLAGFVQPVREA
ncbi:MAG: hypothetical protein ACM3U2_06370, partial [Deltaproteobacteria bacterium]